MHADKTALYGLTMEAIQIPARTDANEDWHKGATHWHVTLRSDTGQMTVQYSMGSAHRRFVTKPRFGSGWTPGANSDPARGARVPQGYGRTVHEAHLLAECTEPIPPTLRDVLSCLRSDAQTVEHGQTFEEWCEDLGYDTDSRRAHRSYGECIQSRHRLMSMIGIGRWDAFMSDESLV